MGHHLLELELEDHLILQGLEELIRREIKGAGDVVEITKELPRIGVLQQRSGEALQVLFDNTLQRLQR